MAQSRLLTRKSSIAWTAGSQASPAAIKSYAVFNPDFNVEQAEVIPGSQYIGSYIGNYSRPGARWAQCNFSIELAGQSAVADDTTPWIGGSLLRACAFDEAFSGGHLATYTGPASNNPHLLADVSAADLDPVNLTWNMDGTANFCNTSCGNAVININAGGISTIDFAFRGVVKTGTSQLLSSLVEAAQTAFTTEVVPKAVRGATATIAGSSRVILGAQYNIGAVIDSRADVNGEFGVSQPIITGFDPGWYIDFEAPLAGTYNPLDKFLTPTAIPISIAATAPATKDKITYTWTGYPSGMAQLSSVNGKAVWRLSGTQSPTTGPFTMAWT